MDIEELTEQLKHIFERVRAGLNQEVEQARKAVKVADNDKTAAQNAFSQLKDQHAEVQKNLDATLKHLGKASSLAALDSEIKNARKELDTLKVEITQATTAVAALKLQQTEAEAKRVATWNEVSNLRTEHREHSDAIAHIRTLFKQAEPALKGN